MPSRTSPAPRIIALSMFLYRYLLKLAPGAFRRDYTQSALQDFQQCCSDSYRERGPLGVLALWPLLFGEAVIGLLAEHLSEIFGRKRPMLPTMRRSMIATFGAFVLFMLAYITLLAIVPGGLPILFMAMRHAIPGGPRNVVKLFVIRPKQALLLLGAALLITICFLGYLLATQYIFGPPQCTSTNGCVAGQPPLILALGFAAIISVITLFVFVILAITASLSLAVLRSEFSEGLLRFSLVPVAILAMVMGVATLAATVWLIGLWILAPQFAASGSGLGYGQTAWVVAIIAAMALATLITIGAFGSGLKASRTREA